MSPGAQGGSKAGPEWPRGEEAEKRLAEYREHSEHDFLLVAYFPLLGIHGFPAPQLVANHL